MSSDPERRALSPMRIAFLVVGLVVISALSYYRLAVDVPGRLVAFSGDTMGTTYQVKGLVPRKADFTSSELQVQVEEKLAHVDGLMSTYKPHT